MSSVRESQVPASQVDVTRSKLAKQHAKRKMHLTAAPAPLTRAGSRFFAVAGEVRMEHKSHKMRRHDDTDSPRTVGAQVARQARRTETPYM
jgi:hypothetical protein